MPRSIFINLLLLAACLAGVVVGPAAARAQVSVTSYHNDAASTGQNLAETRLTPSTVGYATFGKIYAMAVDGQIYAQPLCVPGVTITAPGADQGTAHDVIYVATEHDSLYALDAPSGRTLWQTRLVDDAGGETPVPQLAVTAIDLSPEIGVTSTPVIEPPPAAGSAPPRCLYLVAKSRQLVGGDYHYYLRLHAIDLASGQERPGSPVVIAETAVASADGAYTYISGPSVAGAGDGAVAGRVTLNALRTHQRSALVLIDGKLYFGAASHGTNGPYHGWVLGYDPATLALTVAWNATPNGRQGGVWMGGGRIATDGSGALYFATGNGTFGAFNAGRDPLPADFDADGFPLARNFGDSVVKLVPDLSTPASPNPNGWGLKVADYFCPFNQKDLDEGDLDLGSGGVLILPDTAASAAHPRLLMAGGKEGRLYLLDRDNLGKFRGGVAGGAFRSGGDAPVQASAPNTVRGILSTPAFFNSRLYYAGGYNNDQGRTFPIAGGVFDATPASLTPDNFGYLGSTPSVSASGANNAILWCLDRGTNQLRAYDPANLLNEYYTSAQAPNARDRLGTAVKFGVPTVANGSVFVGTSESAGPSTLVCYGLFAAPSNPPAQPYGLYALAGVGGQISLSWTDAASNETGYEIYVSVDPNNFPAAPTAVTSTGISSWTVGGLQLGATYYCRVRAVNAVGPSAYSNVAAVTTSATAPPVDFSNGFTASAVNSLLASNGFGSAAPLVAGGVLRLTDNGPGEGRSVWLKTARDIRQFSTEWTFRVTGDAQADGFTFAFQRAGSAALGDTGGGMGYAGIAGNSAAVKFDLYPTVSTTGLYLNGAYPTDALPAAGTNYPGSLDATGPGLSFQSGRVFRVTLTYDGTTLRETITDLVSRNAYSVNYTINLRTVLGATTAYVGFTAGTGGLAATQDILSWSYAPALPVAPVPPTGLTAAPASGTQINLAWTDASANETGFRIERKTGANGVWFPIGSVGANVSLYVDAGLLTKTAYFYRVVATNTTADSAFSNEAGATTPVPPNTPTGAAATLVTASGIALRWTDQSDNEDGFRILRRANDGSFVEVAALPPNTTSYQDQGLQPDTLYDYHVQAFNVAGGVDFAGLVATTLSAVSLAVTDGSAQEATADGGAFVVRRSSALDTPLTVNYTLAAGAGQAALGTRYTLSPAAGSVTIPAGATAAAISVLPLADPAVLEPQSVTLTLAAGAGYTPLGNVTGAVTLLDSPVNAWRARMFGSVAAAQSPQAADAADYDGDGLANLVEYALGLDPTKFDGSGALGTQVETADGAKYLTLTFRRPRPAPADVAYLPETAAALDAAGSSWQTAATVGGYPLDNGDGTETMKVRAAQPVTGAGGKAFIRLRIVRP